MPNRFTNQIDTSNVDEVNDYALQVTKEILSRPKFHLRTDPEVYIEYGPEWDRQWRDYLDLLAEVDDETINAILDETV